MLMTVQVDDVLQRDRHGVVPVNTGREKKTISSIKLTQ